MRHTENEEPSHIVYIVTARWEYLPSGCDFVRFFVLFLCDDLHDLLCHTKKLLELYRKSSQQELHHLILEQNCLEIPYVSQLKAVTAPP